MHWVLNLSFPKWAGIHQTFLEIYYIFLIKLPAAQSLTYIHVRTVSIFTLVFFFSLRVLLLVGFFDYRPFFSCFSCIIPKSNSPTFNTLKNRKKKRLLLLLTRHGQMPSKGIRKLLSRSCSISYVSNGTPTTLV